MGIKIRGDSFQADLTYKGERYRKSCATKAEAEQWLLDTKQALLLGQKVTTSGSSDRRPTTLNALKDLTYKRYWSGSKGERTTLINANEVVRLLGESTRIAAITENEIDDLIFKLEKKGNSDATINRKLAALSKMLTFAVERGYIARKPKIERKREDTHRIRWYTQQEEAEIIATAKFMGNHDYANLFIFLIDTGARVGEAGKLRWPDVYLDEDFTPTKPSQDLATNEHEAGLMDLAGVERFPQDAGEDSPNRYVEFIGRKGGTNSLVPLTARTAALLASIKQDSTEYGPFAWLTQGKLANVWSRVRRQMKMQDDDQFVPHAFRHTFCSRLVQAGVPILTVKELAGHKTLAMTLRYAHLAPKNLTNAIAALEGNGYHPQSTTPS